MDKYHVYRPLLDLIGLTEGTDKRRGGGPGRGYNETLAYGRLTGGEVDLGMSGGQGAQLPEPLQLVERHALAAVERVLGVAPGAAERAAGQPHEGARQAGPRAFALDRVEDLRHAQERLRAARLLFHPTVASVSVARGSRAAILRAPTT